MKKFISKLKLDSVLKTLAKTARSVSQKETKRVSRVSKVKSRINVKVGNTTVQQKAGKTWLDVPHEKKFFSNDGRVINNLTELPAVLKEMSNETFLYHVNSQKNDFASWTEHVFAEKKLAELLRRVKNKQAMIHVIKRVI